jgi:hypothetical protein
MKHIGYKKAFVPEHKVFTLVELEIPDDAQTVENDFWYLFAKLPPKCRASKAKVLKIHGGYKQAVSMYDPSFVYEEGQIVAPGLPWEDTELSAACGNGVHYFKEKQDAIKYDTGNYMPNGGNKQVCDISIPVIQRPKELICYLVEDAKCDGIEVKAEISN